MKKLHSPASHRLKIAAASVVVALSVLGHAQSPTYTSLSADGLVDSIGVNIHLNYTDTPYGNFSNIVLPAFRYSGIRHARDGAITNWTGLNANTYFYADMRQLAKVGVKFNLVTSWLTSAGALSALQGWMGGSLESFEGANEPDFYGDPNWIIDTRNWQSTLWKVVQHQPTLAGVKVLAPTPDYSDALLMGSLQSTCNYGNMHPYTGGMPPLTTLPYNQLITTVVSGTKPVIATETGYHNATHAQFGNQPAVDDQTAAKYDLRLLLGMYKAGIARTYIYELLDENLQDPRTDPESSFGLITGTGAYKPAFKAISNLIHLCQDPGPAFTPRPFFFQLSGANSDTRTVLLAKRDNSFLLAIWQEVPSWDTTLLKEIRVPNLPVQVSFSQQMTGTYYNQLAATPAAQGSFGPTSTITLSVNDGVTLVHLVPKTATFA